MKIRLYNPKIKSMRISLDTLIDDIALIVLLLFSMGECLGKLFSIPGYKIVELFFLTVLVLLVTATKKRLNKRALLMLAIVYFIVLVNILLGRGVQLEYIKLLFFSSSYATSLWVYFFIFSLIKDEKKWNRWLVSVAYVNILLLMVTTLLGKYSSDNRIINYIGLGVTCAMWLPIIVQRSFLIVGKWQKLHMFCSVIFLLFLIVYGNRGSVVAVLGFVIYCVLFYTKIKRKMMIGIGIGTVAILIFVFQQAIIQMLCSVIERLGITSRNLTLLLNGQLSYTTHRFDQIWVGAIEAINNKLWLGYGLCYDRVIGEGVALYAHNLALELWISFGVIAGTGLLCLHFWIGYKNCIKNKDLEWKTLFAPFFITSTILLMFNSSFCQLGLFWIPYGTYFAYLKNRKKNAR